MATLILSAVGTAVGGPIGGAVGALLGRAVDSEVIGSRTREGPRLTELAVTTSSYGQPVPRIYGTMRIAGTIIWATDLVESSETSGGKGEPRTTNYSYSMSFAVALSSRPVASIGRVWADGALLRGRAGDLKVGGTMRLHTGTGDQPVDPLIAADKGVQACAFRGLAYVVFEDLELASFGNRIPALSFEVDAGDGTLDIVDLLPDVALTAATAVQLAGLTGFADRGGPRAAMLDSLARLFPHTIGSTADGLDLEPPGAQAPSVLPVPVLGRTDGEDRAVSAVMRGPGEVPSALRYYDPARDFQPSLQRAAGASGADGEVIEFPGVFSAGMAQRRVAELRRRVLAARETLSCRVASLAPEYAPGRAVTRPGDARAWLVRSADWHADGADLQLERLVNLSSSAAEADPGSVPLPVDEQAGAISLRYFELPWDGTGTGSLAQRFAAVGMAGGRGNIAIFGVENETLVPLGVSVRGDAVQGVSATALAGSPALVFEPSGTLDITLSSPDDDLQSVDERALLDGANQLLLGEEILQFRFAEPLGGGVWRLTGLLRGRGGTEHHAAAGHAAGVAAVLLDRALVRIEQEGLTEIAAQSGLANIAPAYATIASPGATLRPLAPVHPAFEASSVGDPAWRWVRRARGAWRWRDGVDAPLAEEREAYRVGFGPVDAPHAAWEVTEPRFTIPATEWAALTGAHPAAQLWVRQIGTGAVSLPSLLPF